MLRHARPIFVLALILTLPILAGEREQTLATAAAAGDLETVKRLITEGLGVDAAVNSYGATALSFAADKGHLEVVRFLLENGADANIKDRFYDSTPINWAIFGGHGEIAALLVEHGADGVGAAQMAINTENFAVAQAILATGKLPAESLTALLGNAREAGAEELTKALEAAGAKLLPPSNFNMSPEALERFAGNYRLEQFNLDITLSVDEGGLLSKNSRNPKPSFYEPTSDTTFRRKAIGDVELHFEFDGDKVTGYKAIRQDTDQPFEFVRVEPEATDEPEVTEAEPAKAQEPAEKPTEEPSPELAAKEAMASIPAAANKNWPAFRGPGAAGTAEGSPVVEWNADGTNILWKTAIPGRAHSSPIVWGDRVFVTTAVAAKPEGEFRHGLYGDVDSVKIETTYDWRIYALHKKTGEILWHHIATEGSPRASHHIKATQANATPVTDGRRVVAILGSEGLYAWDLDGKLLWKRDLGVLSVGWFYDATYEWGHSASPILHEDKVIVQVDRHREPFLAAYSLKDGSELWRSKRDNLPSYSTPTLFEAPSGPEIVTNGTNFIRAYNPQDGKELWRLGPNSELVVGTPVTGHGMVFVTGGYPPVRPIYAIRPGGEGDLSLPEGTEKSEHIAWKTDRGGTYMPTPLVYGDYLYMTSNAGIVTCYNARTGEQIYRDRIAGRGGVAFTASPVAADGRIYWVSEEGDGYVGKAGPEYELLATNPLDEIVMASPAIAGDVLFIRSLQHVYAIGVAGEEGGTAAGRSQAGGAPLRPLDSGSRFHRGHQTFRGSRDHRDRQDCGSRSDL